jgi:hypothetical protein
MRPDMDAFLQRGHLDANSEVAAVLIDIKFCAAALNRVQTLPDATGLPSHSVKQCSAPNPTQ